MTTERYELPSLWAHSEEAKRKEAVIRAPDLLSVLNVPQQTQRNAPLALPHPIDFEHTTEILLPEDWPTQAEEKRIEDPAFTYERKVTTTKRSVTIVERFVSRADHVAAAATPAYAEKMTQARRQTGYLLYVRDPGTYAEPASPIAGSYSGHFNWTMGLLSVLALGAWTWLARRLERHDPEPKPAEPHAPSGIAGWLLLPALGLLLRPFLCMQSMWELRSAYDMETWARLTVPGGTDYHPLYAPLFLFEITVNIGFVVSGVLLLYLFFKCRSSLPRFYIAILWLNLLVQLLDLALASQIPGLPTAELQREITRSLVGLVVWGTYFARSERVSATFTRRRDEPKTLAPPRQERIEPVLANANDLH